MEGIHVGLLITSNGGVPPNFDLLVDSIRTYLNG